MRNALRLDNAGLAGLRVLEIGSGFGLTATTLALLGARCVDCIDSHPGMVETMRSYMRELPAGLCLSPQVGQAQALPYPDAQFNLVIVVEAMSHILQPRRCAAEVHRVLKPGGRFVIVDDNNARNLRAAAQTREVWRRFENGPPTDDIHGHRVREPYVERRRRLLRQEFPVLSPEARHYIENLVDPLALMQELDAMGFRSRPEAYFGGESRGGPVLAVNRLLNALLPTPLLMKRSLGFRIHARKCSNGSQQPAPAAAGATSACATAGMSARTGTSARLPCTCGTAVRAA